MKSEREAPRKLVSIKDYKLIELADIYCITKYLMRKRIKDEQKKIGTRKGYYYTSQQVRKIFELYTLPSNVRIMRA